MSEGVGHGRPFKPSSRPCPYQGRFGAPANARRTKWCLVLDGECKLHLGSCCWPTNTATGKWVESSHPLAANPDMPVRTFHAAPNPKYFNRGRGVTWYNLLSDQRTGLNGITVPGTLHDSLILLAVVLEQQTELQHKPARHTAISWIWRKVRYMSGKSLNIAGKGQ